MYRGVLLYGDSGSGKSSLVNAGLIPRDRARLCARATARAAARRRRARHRADRASPTTTRRAAPLRARADEEPSARTVLAIDAFEQRVRAACERHRPLLIFDQFEEIVTLFDEAGATVTQAASHRAHRRDCTGRCRSRSSSPSARTTWARSRSCCRPCPELVDQALRIAPPTADALPTIISGPVRALPRPFRAPSSPSRSPTVW